MLGIDGVHEDVEAFEVVALDAMIAGITADRRVVDRAFAAMGAEETVVFQGVECSEIEIVPTLRLMIERFGFLQPCLFRIFGRQLVQPFLNLGVLRLPYVCTEGFPEFFTSLSRNSMLTFDTSPAHHSIARTRSRYSASMSSFSARAGVYS